MRLPQRLFARLFLFPLLLASGIESARAETVQVAGSDDRGITLRIEVPAFDLSPAGADGRSRLTAPGLEVSSPPGRAELPFAAVLIALPPGAQALARVVGSEDEELREAVRLSIAPEPVLRDDGNALGIVPSIQRVPPVLDGPWPRSPVEVGEPFTLRHQRVVAIRLLPFRYDEATGRLWIRRSLTVRVDFAGASSGAEGAPVEEDRHWDPVLKGTVLNYEQGRRWRAPKARAVSLETLFPGGLLPGRPAPGVSAAAAFDESEPEVRVRVDSTGVCALDFDLLLEKGYPAGVPIAEVSVHRHDYVEDATPSYQTIELPIEVVEAEPADGVFGPGDRIQFFVQNWAQRSHASFAQRAWGDAEVVYATRLAGRSGLRIATRPGWLELPLAPLSSYPWTQRWERNTGYLPVFQPGVTDTGNTDQFLWVQTGSLVQLYAMPDSFRFETNDMDTAGRVTFSVTWQGSRANNHFQWANIRNGASQFTSVADSLNWFGRGSFTRSVTLFGSALSEGNRNVLRSWGKNSACNDPGNVECQRVNSVVNYFQATYWRRYRALGGYLPCNSAGAAGDFEVRAGGFDSPGIRVYDVTDSLAPVRLSLADTLIASEGSTYAVRFQDSSPAGAMRDYVVFDRPRLLPPDRFSAVTRRNLSARPSGDYLIVVPEEFQSAVGPLASLRESQGMGVVVAPLEAVNDEFNGGRRSSYAIKRFIRYAYRNWDARFVLLVGDASEDPNNFTGTACGDWVPAQKVAAPVGVYDGASNTSEAIVSDAWYVWCVDCADPARQPKIHDLFIGRLPANSLEQATGVVNKIVAYENITPDQTWRRDMLLAADDIFSTQSFFGGGSPGDVQYCQRDYEGVFLEITRAARDVIVGEAGLLRSNAEIFDLNTLLRDEPRNPADTTCRLSWGDTQQHTHLAVTPRMIQKLNQGRLWWNFQGHANPGVLTHEDLYVNRGSNDDKDLLMNDGRPFLFSAFSCHPNTFGRTVECDPSVGPSLGEDMVMLPNRGAIASWASTGFEILPSNARTHLNVHFARALFAHPPIDSPRSGTWDGRVVLGEAIAKTLIDNLVTTGFSLEREVGISYALLGDPATRISVGAAQIVVTANGEPVESGVPVRLRTSGDTLRIEADLASNTALQSIVLERADALGPSVIPPTDYTLTPAFPDTARTGSAGRRYRLVYRTTLDVSSYAYTIRTVDRNGIAARFDLVFRFIIALRAGGVPLADNDVVPPAADLKLLVISPGPIGDPGQTFSLTLNGVNQPFQATPANSDTSRREWELSWTHDPYPQGDYRLQLAIGGADASTHLFRVDSQTRIENPVAFPNPFEDDAGTQFSFYLLCEGTASVQIRVYTVSGRLAYERTEHGLLTGYHQLAWDGRDAEGDKLANGLYLYRLLVRSSNGSAMHEGRLVKLRKPVRKAIESP